MSTLVREEVEKRLTAALMPILSHAPDLNTLPAPVTVHQSPVHLVKLPVDHLSTTASAPAPSHTEVHQPDDQHHWPVIDSIGALICHSKGKVIFTVHDRNNCHLPLPEVQVPGWHLVTRVATYHNIPSCLTLWLPYSQPIHLPVCPDQTSQHVSLQPHFPPSPIQMSGLPCLVSSSHILLLHS